MSIATELTRLQGIRDAIRTKLLALKLISASDADLNDCKDAINGIADRGAVSGKILQKGQVYKVEQGYHSGTGTVQIDSAEQSKLITGNIKSGVTILGVAGSYAGEAVNLQTKAVTPTKSKQTIKADEGYSGLSSVDVEAIPDTYAIVSNVTAKTSDVLAGKVFVDAEGAEKAGTIVNNGAISAYISGLSTTFYTVPAGYHSGSGKVSLNADIETALASI